MKLRCPGIPCAALLALFCAATCNYVEAATFAFPNFSSTTGLNLAASAAQSGSNIRLSAATPNTVGSLWFTTKQSVIDGFDTTFDFRITGMGGASDGTGPGGDGFAFVVQNTSNTASGIAGSYMGYEIANSLAAEFDTWRNANFAALEPSNNHVGVQSNGTGVNDPFAGAYKGAAAVVPNMSDSSIHTGRIFYLPGSLKMYVDDLVNPALTVPVNLNTLLSLSSGTAYVGFTGGGAGTYENHDLLSWTFNVVPEPGTLILAMVASAVIPFRSRVRRSRTR